MTGVGVHPAQGGALYFAQLRGRLCRARAGRQPFKSGHVSGAVGRPGVWSLTDLLKIPTLLLSSRGLLGQSLQYFERHLEATHYVLRKRGVPATVWVVDSHSPGQKGLERLSSPAPSRDGD